MNRFGGTKLPQNWKLQRSKELKRKKGVKKKKNKTQTNPWTLHLNKLPSGSLSQAVTQAGLALKLHLFVLNIKIYLCQQQTFQKITFKTPPEFEGQALRLSALTPVLPSAHLDPFKHLPAISTSTRYWSVPKTSSSQIVSYFIIFFFNLIFSRFRKIYPRGVWQRTRMQEIISWHLWEHNTTFNFCLMISFIGKKVFITLKIFTNSSLPCQPKAFLSSR